MSTSNTRTADGQSVFIEMNSNENDTNNAARANQIFTLQKNIEFLKKNHQDMLLILHKEIERLKKSNNELQQMLVLGKKPLNSPTQDGDKTQLLAKIQDLEQKLKVTLQNNELLKKELDDKKKFRIANNRQAVAESHLPVVQKADKARKCGASSKVYGDAASDPNHQWADGAQFLNENFKGPSPNDSDAEDTLCKFQLPPIARPESGRSNSRLSLVSPGHHTTPTYSSQPWPAATTAGSRSPPLEPRATGCALRALKPVPPLGITARRVPPAPPSTALVGAAAGPGRARNSSLNSQVSHVTRMPGQMGVTSLGVGMGPLLTGITVRPSAVEVFPKAESRTFAATKGDRLSFSGDATAACSRGASQRPPVLSALRHSLQGTLRPLVRRRLDSKDAKKHLF